MSEAYMRAAAPTKSLQVRVDSALKRAAGASSLAPFQAAIREKCICAHSAVPLMMTTDNYAYKVVVGSTKGTKIVFVRPGEKDNFEAAKEGRLRPLTLEDVDAHLAERFADEIAAHQRQIASVGNEDGSQASETKAMSQPQPALV